MMGIAWDIDGRSTGGVGSVCYASGIVGTWKGVERLGLVISVGRDRANLSPSPPLAPQGSSSNTSGNTMAYPLASSPIEAPNS